MYLAAIRAISNNFYTLSTLNSGDAGEGGGGLQPYFLRKKGFVSQYFVTDCLNFYKLKCRSLEYERLLEFDFGISEISLLCSIRQRCFTNQISYFHNEK